MSYLTGSTPSIAHTAKTLVQRHIRKTMRAQRTALSPETVAHHSDMVCKQLIAYLRDRSPLCITAYAACGGEIDLEHFCIDARARGHTIVLPRILNNTQIDFAPVSDQCILQSSVFNIRQPLATVPAIPYTAIDIALVPLTAFDRSGHRIGMGAGYYDRYFASRLSTKTRPELIGIGHDFQCVPHITPQPWDVRLDAAVTETSFYTCTQT